MAVLLFSLITITLILIVLVIYVLKMMNHNGIEELSKFLLKFVKVLLLLTIFGYFISQLIVIIAYVSDGYSELMQTSRAVYPVLLSTQLIFELVFYIAILFWADKLLKNLQNKRIFDKENPVFTKKIGQAFLVLFVGETLTGLFIAAAHFFSVGGSFTITTNPIMFMNLIVGFILLIISSLFENSIRIYEENQLTI